jgi:2-polyprenyl-3-methyl-5-hydroxy-6-metoxy-1,4-benzoquinol methylase
MSEYSTYYNQEHIVYGMSSTRKKMILEAMGDISGWRILDIGCGVGILGSEMKKRGSVVEGVDISAASVDAAKKVIDGAHVSDIQNEKLPFDDASFDVAVCTEVVEHLLFPENVMSEAHRVLKPGGFVIITTPNFLVWSNRLRMLFGRFDYTETGFLDRGHVHFFTEGSLSHMLGNAGLRIISAHHVYQHRVPAWLGRLRPSLFAFQFVVKAVKI